MLYIQNPVFGTKIFTNNEKWCIKTDLKAMEKRTEIRT